MTNLNKVTIDQFLNLQESIRPLKDLIQKVALSILPEYCEITGENSFDVDHIEAITRDEIYLFGPGHETTFGIEQSEFILPTDLLWDDLAWARLREKYDEELKDRAEYERLRKKFREI